MPLPSPSGFTPLSSHTPEPTMFAAPPVAYNLSQFNAQPHYTSPTPAPTTADPYLVPSTSGNYIPQQSFPQYSQYAPSTSPAPQTYVATPAQGQPPPQTYHGYAPTPVPPHDSLSIATIPQSISMPSNFGANSRPLPQQPQVYAQPPAPVYVIPASGSAQQPVNSFGPPQPGASVFPSNGIFQQPPPPPPPPTQYNVGQPQQSYIPNGQSSNLPPPPPPPPSQSNSPNPRPRRQSSLPRPPLLYHQQTQPAYQPPPPPPPPPSEFFAHPLPPPPLPQTPTQLYPGPPPNLPGSIDLQGPWNTQVVQNGYAHHGY
ncbi:hypothetical protein H0H81_007768 [Sphagnurus paluster]|uniref:Uncharacterized protein n=1 Tax=Sphagnurus paluster TaxID=117069 RepID=A0A9P7K4V6_9AGAR|nr:hypothetical protein H0H81_007768 [Sphagnurus paluster]